MTATEFFRSSLPDDMTHHWDLFKYRTLRTPSGDVNTYTEDIFRKQALWCDKPASFNDPFDCNLPLWADEVPASALAQAREKAYDENPRLPSWLLDNALQYASQQVHVITGSIEKERHVIYQKSSVFCWAKHGDNIAMFSYYADCHKGICLQFSLECRHPLAFALDVVYEDNFPNLNYNEITGTDQLVKSLLLTKARCWQHEKERRVFRRAVPPGLESFPASALKRIIFGCRCTEGDVDLVKSWLVDWPAEITLARARPDDKAFTLKIVDFEVMQPPT